MNTRILCLALSLLWLSGCGGSAKVQNAGVVGWAIGHGGTVIVEGRSLEVKKLTDMPTGDFVIQKIDLTNKEVTDADLENLSILRKLQSLTLYGTKVSDAGLDYLTKIEGLKEMDLTKTNITDNGLKKLAEIKSLEKLHVHNTLITNEGLKEFHTALPGCQTFPAKK